MIKYKFALILTAVFSSILLLSVIVLSILQTTTRPDLPNPDSIKLYLNSSSAEKTYNKGTTEYNEVLNIYYKSFEKSFLAQLADNEIINSSINEDTSAPIWNDSFTRTGVYMEFNFDQPKKYIVYRNGNSRRVDITSIIFQLTKEDMFKETLIYYRIEQESSNKDEDEKLYPLSVEANTSKLYNFAISQK